MTACPHAVMPPFLVDGTNVYASRPDGCWRNRERAAARLVAELDFVCETAAETCIVVFDRLLRDQLVLPGTGRVHVLQATRRGRNAAEHTLLTIADASQRRYRLAYTSDRALAHVLRVRGIFTFGARALLARLDPTVPFLAPEFELHDRCKRPQT